MGQSFLRPALVPGSAFATFLPTVIVLLLVIVSVSLLALRIVWRRRDSADIRGTIWKLSVPVPLAPSDLPACDSLP